MATPAKTGEQRQFTMHERLLYDVIQRQAGSLAKAILELVMNAVDAEATYVNIMLDGERLLVKDDGHGFQTRENIINVFEVFGQPHAADEQKTYGTFRMGRGQVMAFGANEWKTGPFRMLVDIKKNGLTYTLRDNEVAVPGCTVRVQLYEPLLPSALAETSRQVERWCKWCPITVLLNDKTISQDPKKAKWDHVTDEAYIRLTRTGDLSVYNLGIHCCSISNWTHGTGGEIVSRKQLRVNFARNDIQSDCPVWKKIKPFVKQEAAAANVKRAVLNDDERENLAQQMAAGELPEDAEAKKLKLFTAVTGRHYNIRELKYGWHDKYSVAEEGDRRGDTLMKQGVAFVFAKETLERFEVKDVPALLKLIKSQDEYSDNWKPVYVPFDKLTKGMNDTHLVLEDKDLSPTEKAWQQVLTSMLWYVRREFTGKPDDWERRYRQMDADGDKTDRRVLIGESASANGWTDGSTYIAINRAFLRPLTMDFYGLLQVGTLLVHEVCHDTDDLASHAHDQAFYELYHELTRYSLPRMLQAGMQAVMRSAEQQQRKLTKRQLKTADAEAKLKLAAAQLNKLAADAAPKE